jgi:hypothetical protein
MSLPYNKFNNFVLARDLAKYNLSSDSLIVALCAAANPPVATNVKIADITQIAYTNLSSRNLTVSSVAQSGGTEKAMLNNLVLTGTGVVAPFRYIVVYDSTATNNELIAWYDIGSVVSLVNNGDNITINFDQVNGFFQSV